MKTICNDDYKEIEDLLLYRRITEVVGDTLCLDNGVQLEIVPNEGCAGCNSGWYSVTEINGCDNAITGVEIDEVDGEEEGETSYRIFVYAEDKKIKILQVDGTDGNGYYGTGYSIRVKVPKKDKRAVKMEKRRAKKMEGGGFSERLARYQNVVDVASLGKEK